MQLRNGTHITQGPSWCVTTLPNGSVVHAHPDETASAMAAELGYDDVNEMTRDHDALHSRLMDWLGYPYSYSLMRAAGFIEVDWGAAVYEEEAVLAIQKLQNKIKAEEKIHLDK